MLLKKFVIFVRYVICSIGLVLISPILLIAALLVLIEDGMPIFFIQDRIGKNKAIFKIIKIRTMKTSAPDTGTHQLDEKYQLKCGKVFRKIKLDEFPQLINVIKGNINLIGPRPGLPSQVELMDARSSNNIFLIKPGITGLAQVLGYDMSNPLILATIDRKYIEKKSFMIDSFILIGTFFKFPRKLLSKLINENHD